MGRIKRGGGDGGDAGTRLGPQLSIAYDEVIKANGQSVSYCGSTH